ncbi:hypothetical protein QFC21_001640 [Naganishia friedmannii]|uniref:Uncharacterized protein n=1 Tax=Naganishia friedmannii TaxID=89922 RepID=A0ACC2W1L8_9TREE|nr:hypothetical protein QFC21_001640 [Naganishia friedmannii]
MATIRPPMPANILPPFKGQLLISPPLDQENAMYESTASFPVYPVANTIPFGTIAKKNKKYPYARPRRATTRLAGPKTAITGESGNNAPLQAVKHRQNFSLGRQQGQQIQRNVSFSKPQKQGDMQIDSYPPSSTSLPSIDERADVRPAQGQTAFVPLKLPRVKIPPVDPSAFCYGRLAEVPPPYVLSHVKQASPEMLRCASLYRPITSCSPSNAHDSTSPSANLPDSHSGPIDISPSDTVRFGIPAGSVLPPNSVFQQLGGGLEPTHCLAVRPRARSTGGQRSWNEQTSFGSAGNAEEGEVGRMIPIHQMVYASQCAYFPRPIVYVPSDRSASTVTSPFSPTFTASSSASTSQMPLSPLSPISSLAGLAQESDAMHQQRDIRTESQPHSQQRRGSDASDRTITSPSGLATIEEEPSPQFQLDPRLNTATSTRSDDNITTDQPQISASTTLVSDANGMENSYPHLLSPVIDLPLVHVTVPFPSLMAPLHGWLYNPSPPILLASLLDLPRDTAATQDDAADRTSKSQSPAVQRLAALPVHSLFVRMQKIHKLWSNTVALGLSDQMLWRVMDRAWDCFVSALKLKGGEAAYEVSLGPMGRGEWSLDGQSEVVRKFSMATIRDSKSRAGSVSSTSSRQ